MTQGSVVNRLGDSNTRGRHASARVSIGTTDVTGERPQRLTQFNYKRTIANGANRAQITLFDESEVNIESLLISGETDVFINYGYSGGPSTPTIRTRIMDYTPTFMVGGVELSLETMSVMADAGAARTRAHTGRISDIVEAIAIQNAWKFDIDRTAQVPANDDQETSARGNKVWQQTAQTDMRFIKEVLLPNAIRSSDDVGDYNLYFNDHTATLHFHPPRLSRKPTRNYVWRGNPQEESSVINFSPSLQGKILVPFGAQGTQITAQDSVTGENIDATADQNNTPGKSLLGDFIQDLSSKSSVSGSEGNAFTSFLAAAGTRLQADAMVKQSWHGMFNRIYKGELTVFGDPFVMAGDLITLTVLLKTGRPHYTSGDYLVLEATDTLNGGEFTTTLGLIKNAARRGPSTTDGRRA